MTPVARKVANLRLQFKKAKTDLLPKIAEDIGKVALERVQAGFAGGQSPYDDAWAPTKAGNSPLVGTTRKLSRSYRLEMVAGQLGRFGFRIFTSVYYALFNQGPSRRGSKTAPGRPQLPVGTKLGKGWAKAMRAAGRASIKRHTPKGPGR